MKVSRKVIGGKKGLTKNENLIKKKADLKVVLNKESNMSDKNKTPADKPQTVAQQLEAANQTIAANLETISNAQAENEKLIASAEKLQAENKTLAEQLAKVTAELEPMKQQAEKDAAELKAYGEQVEKLKADLAKPPYSHVTQGSDPQEGDQGEGGAGDIRAEYARLKAADPAKATAFWREHKDQLLG